MKNASRLRHFVLTNNRFAKTGSGQTWGKHTQKREREREWRFLTCSLGPHPKAPAKTRRRRRRRRQVVGGERRRLQAAVLAQAVLAGSRRRGHCGSCGWWHCLAGGRCYPPNSGRGRGRGCVGGWGRATLLCDAHRRCKFRNAGTALVQLQMQRSDDFVSGPFQLWSVEI